MKTTPLLSRQAARTLAITVLTIAALCASVAVMAWPTLIAAPYPADAALPDSVTFTVNGGAPQPCQLVDVAGGKQPRCDLAALTAPGTYTLVMIATKAAGCNGATCWAAGSASSTPFAYTRAPSGVAAPTGLGLVAQ